MSDFGAYLYDNSVSTAMDRSPLRHATRGPGLAALGEHAEDVYLLDAVNAAVDERPQFGRGDLVARVVQPLNPPPGTHRAIMPPAQPEINENARHIGRHGAAPDGVSQ
jgi:hypothetical protein